MKKYKHLLFDLDKTIWDFDNNSRETIFELYNDFGLQRKGIGDFNVFFLDYEKVNLELWGQYRQNTISKEELMYQRFNLVLLKYGIDDLALAKEFSDKYLQLLPSKTKVFPGTYETLQYLCDKYAMHIVTNGFEEVQFRKIQQAGLEKYFDQVITSEKAGYKKPDRNFFDFTLREIHAAAHECLMIGDDIEVDLMGSMNAGIDQVFFNYENINHEEIFTYEISQLNELTGIL
ncbi:MAG TPA: YjjG family noncanonical pyrimidine nucleotidase [Bacteroidales bacterium]|nr:YjjG family noncanonical pyrimidine nucleotidase [Bacteroidales bacterium]